MRPRRRRTLALVKKADRVDLAPELQRVLSAAARDVARELGRQAAREAFAVQIRSKTQAS